MQKELFEYEVIAHYLSAPLSADELLAEVKKLATEAGVTSVKEMGRLIGLARQAGVGLGDTMLGKGHVKSSI